MSSKEDDVRAQEPEELRNKSLVELGHMAAKQMRDEQGLREQEQNRQNWQDQSAHSQGTTKYVLIRQRGSKMVATPIDTLYGSPEGLEGVGPNAKVAITELRFSYAVALVHARQMPDLPTARKYCGRFEFIPQFEGLGH